MIGQQRQFTRRVHPTQAPRRGRFGTRGTTAPTIYIVSSGRDTRRKLSDLLERDKRPIECFEAGEEFFERSRDGVNGCLLVDYQLPGMSGLELINNLVESGLLLPTVMMTGRGRVKTAVEAIRAGAADVLEMPISEHRLRNCMCRAMSHVREFEMLARRRRVAAGLLAELTPRQQEVLQMVLAGDPSKNIAVDLGISQRTVESHRAEIMQKTGAKSIPALARMAVMANWYGDFPQ